MALVGNISGSSNTNSLIGVTGSVIFSNNPGGSFPANLPGQDVQFFVSGSIGGKNGNVRNVAVIGGDAVVSGTLTVGTGSIVVTSNDIQIGSTGHVQFGTSANRIALVGSDLKFFDGSNPTGQTLTQLASGGGSGTNFFTENGNGVIYNSGSVAFTGARTGVDATVTAASQKGADVQFYFSGSTDGSKIALFGGGLVSSGTLKVLGAGGALAGYITNQGEISGSGNFRVGSNLTVAGNSTLGDAPGDTVTVNGTTTFIGNAVTTTFQGDIAVNNGNITTTATNTNIFGSATTVTIGNNGGTITSAGKFKVNGDVIQSSAGTPVLQFSGSSVTVVGDLFVSGTSTIVNSNTTTIQDPVFGLGFASASGGPVPVAAGDRGFIGGITGAGNNVFMGWSNATNAFVVAKTATNADAVGLTGAVNVANLQPLRLSKAEFGGTTATITSSDGLGLRVDAANTQGVALWLGGGQYGLINGDGSSDLVFGATGGKKLYLSGSSVVLRGGAQGVLLQRDNNTIGSIQGQDNVNLSVQAVNLSGGPTALILTGSNVTVGAHNGPVYFNYNNSELGRIENASGDLNFGSATGKKLGLSGSNGLKIVHGSGAANIAVFNNLEVNSHLEIGKNVSGVTVVEGRSSNGLTVGNGNGGALNLSGSFVYLNSALGNGTIFEADGADMLKVHSAGANKVTLVGQGSFTTADVFDTVSTTLNIGGASTTFNAAYNQTGAQTINLATGATTTGNTKAINIGTGGLAGSTTNITLGSSGGTGTIVSNQNLEPAGDKAQNLGSANKRWANIYTGDLHLRNDRGNWTIIEEEDYLSITNNLSGKRYKFVLEEL